MNSFVGVGLAQIPLTVSVVCRFGVGVGAFFGPGRGVGGEGGHRSVVPYVVKGSYTGSWSPAIMVEDRFLNSVAEAGCR